MIETNILNRRTTTDRKPSKRGYKGRGWYRTKGVLSGMPTLKAKTRRILDRAKKHWDGIGFAVCNLLYAMYSLINKPIPSVRAAEANDFFITTLMAEWACASVLVVVGILMGSLRPIIFGWSMVLIAFTAQLVMTIAYDGVTAGDHLTLGCMFGVVLSIRGAANQFRAIDNLQELIGELKSRSDKEEDDD